VDLGDRMHLGEDVHWHRRIRFGRGVLLAAVAVAAAAAAAASGERGSLGPIVEVRAWLQGEVVLPKGHTFGSVVLLGGLELASARLAEVGAQPSVKRWVYLQPGGNKSSNSLEQHLKPSMR
jgi:hypothetical protein